MRLWGRRAMRRLTLMNPTNTLAQRPVARKQTKKSDASVRPQYRQSEFALGVQGVLIVAAWILLRNFCP
jgi:hypothetical protein